MGTPLPTETDDVDRWQATKAVLPFMALGLIDLVLILKWGLNPLWGFAILPPMIFISILAWISFKSGFISENSEYYEGE